MSRTERVFFTVCGKERGREEKGGPEKGREKKADEKRGTRI